jgi:hypothetical protein
MDSCAVLVHAHCGARIRGSKRLGKLSDNYSRPQPGGSTARAYPKICRAFLRPRGATFSAFPDPHRRWSHPPKILEIHADYIQNSAWQLSVSSSAKQSQNAASNLPASERLSMLLKHHTDYSQLELQAYYRKPLVSRTLGMHELAVYAVSMSEKEVASDHKLVMYMY